MRSSWCVVSIRAVASFVVTCAAALGGALAHGQDCNNNGVDDAQDIADLTSDDCQPNGIPDECELVGNDCNGDGRPDECGVEDACLEAAPTAPVPLYDTSESETAFDSYPQFATDGKGNWIVVWQSTNDLGGTIGSDWDILFTRSDDNGQTWSAPRALDPNATTGAATWGISPWIATDGNGMWLVTWETGAWDTAMTRSFDNGATWSDPNAPMGNARDVRIATDRQGRWIAVASSETHPSSGSADAEIIFSVSDDNADTWSPPSILNTTAPNDGESDDLAPEILTTGHGTWLVAWHRWSGVNDLAKSNLYVSRSLDNGATWSTPDIPHPFDSTQRDRDYGVSLATDEADTIVATWSHKADGGPPEDVKAVRSTDHGITWDGPIVLASPATTGSGADLDADVATDRAGNWYAVWRYVPPEWPPFPPDRIYFSRSADSGATWSAPLSFETYAGASLGAPQIAPDGRGGWMTTWHSNVFASGTVETYSDVVVARFGASGDDCNCNGVPDLCENDCNCNGVDDSDDIDLGTSEDCNADGVPDECQVITFVDCDGNLINDACDLAADTHPDCNGNTVPDLCDLAAATSTDCNGNGIPDACDVADGTSPDCNGNGISDVCDIADGTSPDCNENAAPDSCDIANGTAIDCNGNGAPDACDISSGSSTDDNGDGIPDDCCPPWPPEPVAVAPQGSRYLSLSQVGQPGVDHAIRVRLVALDGFAAHEDYLWVDAPRTYPDEDSSMPERRLTASRLTCTPYYTDWSNLDVLHVFGGEVMPSSEYEIELIAADCDPGAPSNWSDVVTVRTGRLGDVVTPFFDPVTNSGQPDFSDIAASVQKFLGAPGAPSKALAQVQPNTAKPHLPVNFNDVAAFIQSFLGAGYAGMPFVSGPCTCPSVVTCGAKACGSDEPCSGGVCLSGDCYDACGRCSP